MRCTVPLLIDSSTSISRVDIPLFCRMSSYTAKSWHCWSQRAPAQGVASPLFLRVPPHNADTTGIWCTVQDTALRTPHSSHDKFVKHAPLLSEEIG
ncbi:hypothetical protein AVEN_28225-1 [Araneus ventricosus]|uniref:Uncharacterized protein n=1 Tax=Araneus ventricosus TaxID=182803 RepID=A0A4Y2V225_ARAVE|nr:hypothetical protein AVEN_28225-1 [Araneus ventricosus]